MLKSNTLTVQVPLLETIEERTNSAIGEIMRLQKKVAACFGIFVRALRSWQPAKHNIESRYMKVLSMDCIST